MYDAIVPGLGGVGSMAVWRLAKRGLKVFGVDQFHPPHGLGSSHGETRIIRQAYFEHPDYVPLARAAYTLWDELEAVSGEALFARAGLVQVGPASGVVVPGVLRAARLHGLDVESPRVDEARRRWPELGFPEDLAIVFEPTAGYLHVERGVAAALSAAQRAGAELLYDTTVVDWRAEPTGIRVRTAAGEFACERLVIAAGPWAGRLLAPLIAATVSPPFEVRRKAIFWFSATSTAAAKIPPYLFELPTGVFYGFPAIDGRLKLGDHAGGQVVDDPRTVDRGLDVTEAAAANGFVRSHLGSIAGERVDHGVCLYTMSRDEHFIVDHWPGDQRIAFAAGLSGHGYKFAPVLGEALADLVTTGGAPLPMEFLSLQRFG